MDLGTRINELRCERNLRQQDLAELAGISQEAVSQIVRGRVNPTLPTLFIMASAMGLTITELFDGVTGAAGYEGDDDG